MKKEDFEKEAEEQPEYIRLNSTEPINAIVWQSGYVKGRLKNQREWIDGLNQLGFKISFDEESNSWFAERKHDKNIIIVTGVEQNLSYEIILSYQALLLHKDKELEKRKI